MEDHTAVHARRVEVTGRVQGVFFRSWTRQTAQRAGVTGWVRNRADGSVEAWLEGAPGAVEHVLDLIELGGPPAAVVDEVVASCEQPAGHTGFVVQRR